MNVCIQKSFHQHQSIQKCACLCVCDDYDKNRGCYLQTNKQKKNKLDSGHVYSVI